MDEAHVSGLGLQLFCRQAREHSARRCPANERHLIANGLPRSDRYDAADEEQIRASSRENLGTNSTLLPTFALPQPPFL
jgi:hypothetical protein